MKLSEELESRGFVHQFVGNSLAEIVDGEKRVVYHGIDPTADSAHVGNLVSWLLLKHLANAGHKVIFLVGGGTGRIGDPKPDEERTLTPTEEIDVNVANKAIEVAHDKGKLKVVFKLLKVKHALKLRIHY